MSRLLLDTHVVIWLAFDRSRLAPPILERLADPAHELHVSSVSAIEVALKTSLGKLPLPPPFQVDFQTAFGSLVSRLSARLLDIELGAVGRLPQLPLHHRDPFDRLLVAQAVHNGLALVTHDRALAPYDQIEIVWV